MHFVAAVSLLLTGFVVSENIDFWQMVLVLWSSFCGVIIVYRFNDLQDENEGARITWKQITENRFHLLFLIQFIFITTPLFLLYLSKFRLIILSLICILGVVYSIKFSLGKFRFRLKNVFLLKNLIIGILWGALVIVGVGTASNDTAIALFLFTSMQVFIGSSLRDFLDISEDRKNGVNSIPIKLGIPQTITLLHVFNIITAISILLLFSWREMALVVVSISIWKFITIHKVSTNPNSYMWAHTLNFLTCAFIFLIVFGEYIYGKIL